MDHFQRPWRYQFVNRIIYRSTMTGKRLHNLAPISVEKEKNEEFMKNPDEILNEFASCDK